MKSETIIIRSYPNGEIEEMTMKEAIRILSMQFDTESKDLIKSWKRRLMHGVTVTSRTMSCFDLKK